ncbi:MAG: P-loop NTPase fold protein [Gammaproteobacteria bacterium]
MLDDQPARSAGDKLRFARTIEVIRRQVLERPSVEPFTVGLFGRWGSGKSSLLAMLEEELEAQNRDARARHCEVHPIQLARHPPEFVPPWIVVRFSPWVYREETSLLLALLATLAKKRKGFAKFVRALARFVPNVVETAGKMGVKGVETYGVPLLSFLESLRKRGEAPKDLVKQIEEQVGGLTDPSNPLTGLSRFIWLNAHVDAVSRKCRLVFLIDDLDRCHDPNQIVGLLEQINLFLHLPRCLFFIAADRGQIVKAIEARFRGEGERYLEKFVQLAIDLPQPDRKHLLELLPEGIASSDRACMARIGEVLGHNPRKLKLLWNRAQSCLALARAEMQGVTGFSHTPELPLMARCLLVQEAGLFQRNPYMALALEAVLRDAYAIEAERREHFDALLKAGEPLTADSTERADPIDPWRERLRRRLTIYLWQDRDTRFGSSRVFALYLKATGAAFSVTRAWLEERLYDREKDFAFLALADEDLSGAQLCGARFRECDFERADLSDADLGNAHFERCRFAGALLDNARFGGVGFTACEGLDKLDTAPETYRRLADLLTKP